MKPKILCGIFMLLLGMSEAHAGLFSNLCAGFTSLRTEKTKTATVYSVTNVLGEFAGPELLSSAEFYEKKKNWAISAGKYIASLNASQQVKAERYANLAEEIEHRVAKLAPYVQTKKGKTLQGLIWKAHRVSLPGGTILFVGPAGNFLEIQPDSKGAQVWAGKYHVYIYAGDQDIMSEDWIPPYSPLPDSGDVPEKGSYERRYLVPAY